MSLFIYVKNDEYHTIKKNFLVSVFQCVFLYGILYGCCYRSMPRRSSFMM